MARQQVEIGRYSLHRGGNAQVHRVEFEGEEVATCGGSRLETLYDVGGGHFVVLIQEEPRGPDVCVSYLEAISPEDLEPGGRFAHLWAARRRSRLTLREALSLRQQIVSP